MSYYIRETRKGLQLTQHRGITELGYSGPILTLPKRMADGFVKLERVLEVRYGDEIELRVFPDHTTRCRHPVIKVRVWRGGEPMDTPGRSRTWVVTAQGELIGKSIEALEGHFDPFEWIQSVGFKLSDLDYDYVKHFADIGHKDAIAALSART